MSGVERERLPGPKPSSEHLPTIAKCLLAACLALVGAVLLIATKSTAGAALLLAALLVVVPLQRLSRIAHPYGWARGIRWLRITLVGSLVLLALIGIAGTDLPPDQATTGVKFLDQLLAIGQRFQDNLLGRSPPPRR